jgi:hypothetical protein
MFITLLVVGCLGAVAGQGDFEAYLREHKAFGKAVAAMICLYGMSKLPRLSGTLICQFSRSILHGVPSPGLCKSQSHTDFGVVC